MKYLFGVGTGIAVLLQVAIGPALAALSTHGLSDISAAPAPGAALPLQLGFRDENGRPRTLGSALAGKPNVVIFADYTCRTLCGPILDFAASALTKTGLQPGSDYRVVVIGLDPRDGLDVARAMKATHFGDAPPIARATLFLSGEETAITSATAAVGYHYQYDPQHDQFAHPAAVYVTDAQGRVARTLSGVGIDSLDLRLALVDAGRGTIGSFTDRVRLLCYGYDPVRGIYSERITLLLELAAGASVLMLGAGIASLLALERRKAAR